MHIINLNMEKDKRYIWIHWQKCFQLLFFKQKSSTEITSHEIHLPIHYTLAVNSQFIVLETMTLVCNTSSGK